MCDSINLLVFFSLQIVIHGCFFGRFPFIACEIFACEIDAIFKTLVEYEEVGCFLLELGDSCFYIFLLLSTIPAKLGINNSIIKKEKYPNYLYA